jgi:tetratricopeptide (TPR) repeat protein
VPKPLGPDEDLFDYATLAFGQKEYGMAAQSYGQYIANYGNGRHVSEALFRLGECYMNQNKQTEADRYYAEVVNRYPKDDIAASAAYRLAASRYNAGDFKAAATYFNFCELNTKVSRVRLAAAFYKSLAFDQLHDDKKQREALKTVLAVLKDNEFREKALVAMAAVLQREGKNDEAQPILNEIIAETKDPAIRADAALKAAVLYSENKDSEAAIRLFGIALKGAPGSPPELQGAALVGLVNEYYLQGDYDSVIDTYNRNASLLPPLDLRPRLLMHVGNAQRMKKNYAQAIDIYDMLERYHPQADLAFEAGYWKLYCFYLTEDKRLPAQVRTFLDRYAELHAKHEFTNTARLLRADYLFNHQVYKLAADAYQEVRIDQLAEKYRPSTLFHKGWSEAETARHNEAIASLSKLITTYPKEADIPKALAKRGISYKEIKDNAKALADFGRIISEFPQNEGVELAHYLSGIIHNDTGDKKAMIADFEALLSQFPHSSACAEAAFRTGSAYSELGTYEKAVPMLHKAAELDPKNYRDPAYQKLILCHWARKDVEALAKVVDDYRSENSKANIPSNALGFLGLMLFDKKDYARCARYLTWAATPESPSSTDARIWNYLGQAQLEAKNYNEAIAAISFYLAAVPDSLAKARGYHTKAQALLGMGETALCKAAAEEGLRIVKEGVVQGQLLLVQGDALFAEGDKLDMAGNHDAAVEKWKAAAGKYLVPSQLLSDDTLTPKALAKAIKALERLGDNAGAAARREQLKKDYPDYKLEE